VLLVFAVFFGLVAYSDWRLGIRPFDRVRDR